MKEFTFVVLGILAFQVLLLWLTARRHGPRVRGRRPFLSSLLALLGLAGVSKTTRPDGAYWLPAMGEGKRRLASRPAGGPVLDFYEFQGRSWAFQRDAAGLHLWEIEDEGRSLRHRHTAHERS